MSQHFLVCTVTGLKMTQERMEDEEMVEKVGRGAGGEGDCDGE